MNNDFDDIFSNSTNDEQIEVLSAEEKPPKKKFSIDFDLKNDKVLLAQILLLAAWVILTIIIYFFGYNLFEPFINV